MEYDESQWPADPRERRKLQNRINQRNYRKNFFLPIALGKKY